MDKPVARLCDQKWIAANKSAESWAKSHRGQYNHRVQAPRALFPLGFWGASSLLGFWLLAACHTEPTDRPPPAMLGGADGVIPLPSGKGDGDGDDGDGEEPGDGDGASHLALALARYTDTRFLGLTEYSQPTLALQLESGGLVLNSVELPEGVGTLPLTAADEAYWVAVYPQSDSSMLPTLIPNGRALGHTFSDIEEVALVPQSLLHEILATTSGRPALGGAQLLLRFVDHRGDPLAGVFVDYVQGGLYHSYASTGTWNETRVQSDAEGLCLYYNIPAAALPGTLHDVELSGAIAGSFRVQLVDGAVTVATFRAPRGA